MAHDSEQPRAAIATTETIKESKRTQTSFLHHILRVVLIPRQPTCQIVRRVQVRQDGLLKLRQLAGFCQVSLSIGMLQPKYIDWCINDFIPGAPLACQPGIFARIRQYI